MRHPSFEVRKWYFDSVDNDGNLLIAYAGVLKWKAIRLSFSSLLKKFKNERAVTNSSLRKIKLPERSGTALRYVNPLFSIELATKQTAMRETLISTDKGSIEWNCHYPLSASSIQTEQLCVSGHGYAEELVMTIKPWEFKIKELYWGRFTSANSYVTWIEWRGEWKQFFIYHNGNKYAEGKIDFTGVEFSDGCIEFYKPEQLRSGSLASTVFKKFPLFRKLFPLKALMIEETKWFSKGTLKTGGHSEEGFCVYEKVSWL